MLFALTRSNLLRQLPDLNEITLRLTQIATANNSTTPEADKSKHLYDNCYNYRFDNELLIKMIHI